MADSSGLIGRVFEGRYRLEAEIGHGSMATVFRAVHVSMQHTVAVKVLTELAPGDDPQVGRFSTEVRACSRLKHPNTIRVFDFGRSEDGYLYLVMEFLEGESLGMLLAREGPLPVARAAGIARQVAKSLGEAHGAGLVHRDLKPDNLFLTEVFGEKDFVKVLDFGVAKVLDNASGDEPMTQAGVVLGTPLYLSPEQALGRDLDGRTDLYALGAMLYEMLTGRPPFRAPSPIAVVMKHIHDAVPSFATANPAVQVPPALEALVLAMLAKDRQDRPASAEAFLEALDLALEGVPLPPRRMTVPTHPGTPALDGVAPATSSPAPSPAGIQATGVPAPATIPAAATTGRAEPVPALDPDDEPGAHTLILSDDEFPLRLPPHLPPAAAPKPESRVTHDWGTSSPVAHASVGHAPTGRRHAGDDEGIVFSGDDDAGGVTLILDRTDMGQALAEARTALDLSGSPRVPALADPGAGPPALPAARSPAASGARSTKAPAGTTAASGLRWTLVVGVVLVLGLAGGAAWAFLGDRGDPSPSSPPVAAAEPAAPEPAAAPSPAPVPAATPAPAAAPDAPSQAPQPVVVTVTVTTTPPAAEVMSGGSVIGRTPHTLRLRDGDPAARLQFRAPGFQALDVTLIPRDVVESGRTSYAFDLAPEPAPVRKAATTAPRPSDRPAVEPRAQKAPEPAAPPPRPRPAPAPKPAKKPVLNWDD